MSATPKESALITVDNVNFAYKNDLILKNISFQIQPGEYVGIIGPNGGGKTTLLKLLMGFLQPTSGHISLFGQSPKQARPQIAYVPQNQRFDPRFPISVLEVVLGGTLRNSSLFGRYSRKKQQHAIAALEQVGLVGIESQAFSQLSGGQAQRVLIARALVSDPKLLLLDEPTANVDTETQQQIFDLIQTLHPHVTVLMVTHDLPTIIKQVQRVLCVQTELFSLQPEKVCEHFAIGLYHTPLIKNRQTDQPEKS